MIDSQTYALKSANVYEGERRGTTNDLPWPSGWERISFMTAPDASFGFTAGVFRNLGLPRFFGRFA